jgi:hypothetical protein
MRSLLVPSVPYYRNPQFRPALAALVELLMARNYSSRAIGNVFDFVACNGTLEGSLVALEDMADAEAVFVDALPEIPFDVECWGSTEDLDDLDVPPIAGGSPEADPGPTEADRRDFEAWLSQVDADYPPDAQVEAEVMRAWYRRNPIGDLNADRAD